MVGQAEVVAVLVREHRDAAVLRLDRVVGDPQAGVADLRAAVLVERGPAGPDQVLERLPAVRPDRVLALVRVAVGLVAAGVDDLEVVDVAVALVEVAVVVVVVAVPGVVGRELRGDLRVGGAGGLPAGDPGVDRVLDQEPRVAAHVGGAREAVAAAVARLVELDLDPVGDQAVDAVAARRLALVVGLERLAVAEVDVLVVRAVVVRLPDRRVVLRPVGRRDRVVERPVERGRPRDVRVGVPVRVARMARVPELGQDHEDLVRLLARELDVLVLAVGARDLDDLARAAPAHLRVARDHLLERDLAQRAALLLGRVRQLVHRRALYRGPVRRRRRTRAERERRRQPCSKCQASQPGSNLPHSASQGCVPGNPCVTGRLRTSVAAVLSPLADRLRAARARRRWRSTATTRGRRPARRSPAP